MQLSAAKKLATLLAAALVHAASSSSNAHEIGGPSVPERALRPGVRRRRRSDAVPAAPQRRGTDAAGENGTMTDLPVPTPALTPSEAVARAAALGDVRSIANYSKRHRTTLTAPDGNGWAPVHLAARGGHLDAVQFFAYHGANVNERTNFGEGRSCLELVLEHHGRDHPLARYLMRMGAEAS